MWVWDLTTGEQDGPPLTDHEQVPLPQSTPSTTTRMELSKVAQQVIMKYTDDLDGSEASGNVEFALDGREYEIDLSDDNAQKLRDMLAPFVAAARRSGDGRGRQTGAGSPPQRSRSGRSREELAEMRTWLRENGYKVSDRGRIPNEFLQAWESKTPGGLGDVQPANPADTNSHAVEFQSA
ncbi:Lsr2 family protein [Pseudonocardia sp. N23]|uniref:histone-like nucleoid-structuring protein Lsr2 n=1 Tax=Pseudonocardia sp. N23 TaxID=1987376 RepID=UPI000C02DAAC|nr:histone protein Lsr2 [Pseudonocardia sp. N23]